MLQLVGRHEMDKVQLQRESDLNNPNKVLVRQAASLCLHCCVNSLAPQPTGRG